MKASSLRYLTKEGFRNIRVNRLMSLASVTVLMSCLVIIGAAVLLFLNINNILVGIESQNIVMAFVQDGVSEAQTAQVGTELGQIENVDTVEFVSREEGYQSILESMGGDASLLEGVDSGFLPDSYRITLKDMSAFAATVAQIKAVPNVMTVRENTALADKLTEIRNSVTYVAVGIIALLLIVSLFIIGNTVRVTMYNRRLEIGIMKAVGATNSFIRWPFVIEGMIIGLFAACLSELVLYILYTVAENELASIVVMFDSSLVPFTQNAVMLFVFFAVTGVLTGVIGSSISMGRYLRNQGGVV